MNEGRIEWRPSTGVCPRTSYSQPAWFVGGTKLFVMLDWRRPAFWAAAGAGVQEARIAEDPKKFYRQPYLGKKGFLGVYVDVPTEWDEITGLIQDAYKQVAPPKYAALLK